jgi:Cu+-exporting ATPase
MAVVSFVLASFTQIFLGGIFYKGAISALRNKAFNMDSLIAIGTTTAYIYSSVNFIIFFAQSHSLLSTMTNKPVNLYFETSVFLLTFVILGKWLEARAINKTGEAIKNLIQLQPKTAHLIKSNNTQDILVDNIKLGDKLLVKPGEQIPVDGQISKGITSVDESMITGESFLVDKTVTNKVVAGTINGMGTIEITAQALGENTVLAQIIKLVAEANASKAPIENVADKISAIFVPTVLIIAVITFLIWYYLLNAPLSDSIMLFISVVVISCPCALGLATPTAVTVGIGQASRLGILIKSGEILEKLSKINTVVFDKTGTLTVGQPFITDIIDITKSKKQILQIAATLESGSEHSLAQAVLKKADLDKIKPLLYKDFQAVSGFGVQAIIDNKVFYFGNNRFVKKVLGGEMGQNQLADINKIINLNNLVKEAKTLAFLFDKSNILGVIAMADKVKISVKQAIDKLSKQGIETYILSGDSKRGVEAVASQFSIINIFSEVLPDEKSDKIAKLQSEGQKVAMVGDGVNDAPAIAVADVGVAMGTGTDVAIETGDVVLVKADPVDVSRAISLSKAVVLKIHQNLFFSLIYNFLGIPIAAGVFSFIGLVLRPEIAGLAMVLSSITVVLNSLTLKFFKFSNK